MFTALIILFELIPVVLPFGELLVVFALPLLMIAMMSRTTLPHALSAMVAATALSSLLITPLLAFFHLTYLVMGLAIGWAFLKKFDLITTAMISMISAFFTMAFFHISVNLLGLINMSEIKNQIFTMLRQINQESNVLTLEQIQIAVDQSIVLLPASIISMHFLAGIVNASIGARLLRRLGVPVINTRFSDAILTKQMGYGAMLFLVANTALGMLSIVPESMVFNIDFVIRTLFLVMGAAAVSGLMMKRWERPVLATITVSFLMIFMGGFVLYLIGMVDSIADFRRLRS